MVMGGMCGEGGHAWQRRGMCGEEGGMHGERGHTWQRGEGDVCGKGGHAWQGGACVAGETTTAADGKHPVGMHSCSFYCHQNNGQNGSVHHSVRYSHHHHWYNAKR